MITEDIEYLERSMSSFKLKYIEMESWFPLEEATQSQKRYIIAFNITNILDMILEMKSQINETLNYDFHAAISLLNIVAHYKHFYSSKMKSKSTIILYTHSYSSYKLHENILNKLKTMCEFIPGIIYIDPISDKENIYPHITYALIQLIKITNNSQKLQTIVHVYSNHNIDYQLIFSSESKENRLIKISPWKTKIETKFMIMSKVFGNKDFYNKNNYKSEIETMFIPFGLYMNTIVKGPNPLIHMKGERKEARLQNIINFLNKHNGKTDTELFEAFKSELIDEKDRSIYQRYLEEHDYHSNKYVIELAKNLLNLWSSKIKDYNLIKDNEKVRILKHHDLRLNWLLY